MTPAASVPFRLRLPVLAAALPIGGCAEAPSFMAPAGEPGGAQATLGWWATGVASGVVLLVCVLLVAGLLRHRGEPQVVAAPERREARAALRWVLVGTVASTLVLLAFFVATVSGLQHAGRVAEVTPLTVEVVGHQWWWEVRYPREGFTTANEIHIPVGERVRLRVTANDVIHSFWVPQLAGKMDMIPGQTNEMWLEASQAGTFRGQCGEYCGLQHANMTLVVVAEPRERFDAWQASQRAAAAVPVSAEARAGAAVFELRCAVCHSVQGTRALGKVGPDLTHLASRRRIAAGRLPNDSASLARWIADPQAVKPGTFMPRIGLSASELTAVVEYLENLR